MKCQPAESNEGTQFAFRRDFAQKVRYMWMNAQKCNTALAFALANYRDEGNWRNNGHKMARSPTNGCTLNELRRQYNEH